MYIECFSYRVSCSAERENASRPGSPSRPARLDRPFPLRAVDDSHLLEVPPQLARYRCKSNRMLMTVLDGIRESVMRYDPARVGVVIGTSGSGIAAGEAALIHAHRSGAMPAGFHYKQQELGGAGEFAARWLKTCGPAYTLSTSCASSAHALNCARNLLRLRICDAVVAGGVETLSGTTAQGFAALGALSRTFCNPFSRHRDGTVLGEGAAVFLLTRQAARLALVGVGMSSDAYHLSAPDPEGSGAKLAMTRALADAGLGPKEIGYLNLHGTGTVPNDAMEALAVDAVFGKAAPPCSSTKPLTGHCLGAAGAVELACCAEVLLAPEKPLPVHRWDGCSDPVLPELHFTDGREKIAFDRPFCMSNTYAFGGANVSLIIGRMG